MDQTLQVIRGTLYGQAIGDAFGMPGELWSRAKIQDYFGEINDFLDGPESNEVAKNFTKGQFTDDTATALVILDSLIATDFQPKQADIAEKLIQWGEVNQAFEKEIFGPSTKAALLGMRAGKCREELGVITNQAITNGSAMRISPIGLLFTPDEATALIDYVTEITATTHSSDVAIAGAVVVAGAVSYFTQGRDWADMLEFVYHLHDLALSKGTETYQASIKERIKLGIDLAHRFQNADQDFLQAVYDLLGTTTLITESVPAALAIAYYAQDVTHCAKLCANLGGDTDTIGCMACAICGAYQGFDQIDSAWVELIDEANAVNLETYVEAIYTRLKEEGKLYE